MFGSASNVTVETGNGEAGGKNWESKQLTVSNANPMPIRFEAEFPLGLPEEYGIRGGVFLDVGSVWGLNDRAGTGAQPNGDALVDDSFHLRSSIGVSIFWTTPIGPLRFNLSRALAKQDYDKEQTFDLTISTSF